jgi:hypothetical protein
VELSLNRAVYIPAYLLLLLPAAIYTQRAYDAFTMLGYPWGCFLVSRGLQYLGVPCTLDQKRLHHCIAQSSGQWEIRILSGLTISSNRLRVLTIPLRGIVPPVRGRYICSACLLHTLRHVVRPNSGALAALDPPGTLITVKDRKRLAQWHNFSVGLGICLCFATGWVTDCHTCIATHCHCPIDIASIAAMI